MSALIGALRVSLSAETSSFEAGMKRAQRQAQSSSSAISKSLGLIKAGLVSFVSGLSVGLFVNAIKGALDYAGSLGEVSQQLGVTTRDLQVFRFAAGQNGISVEQADKGLQKLTLSLSKASAGSKPTIAAFNAVGVSLDDIKSKGAVEIFGQMADGMNKTGGASKNAAAGAVIMGREFQKFVPLADQGSKGMNALSQAAERLGIVLSDEQIQKADDTADKLDALQTVLKAQIAGAVADNADAILDLANAISKLVSEMAGAAGQIKAFYYQVSGTFARLQMESAQFVENMANSPLALTPPGMLLNAPGLSARRKATISQSGNDAAEADWQAFLAKNNVSGVRLKRPPAPRPSGGNPSQFLAGGGGGSKKGRAPREDHSAERALSDAFRFDQDIRRAQQDVLSALRDLSTDYVERTTISIQMLDLEKQSYEAELAYQTELYRLTKGKEGLSQAQAAQLKIEYDKKDALEREKVLVEEQVQRREEMAHLQQTDFDLERDRLESIEQLATTAKEQRDVQLRLLDLSYRQERARLEAVIADEQASVAAKEEARRRLANLNQTYGNDRQNVINNTRGPMEDFFSSVPKNAAEAQEAMERLQVMGIQGAIDSVLALGQGFDSFRDTAIRAIQAVIAELIRMQLMKLAMSLIGSAAGGGAGGEFGANPIGGAIGMAVGGRVTGSGSATSDSIPAMLSNGEFVVNAKSAKRFMPLLEKINAGGFAHLARGGLPIPRLPHGEMSHITPDGQAMGGGNHFNVNVNGAMSDRDARRTGMQIALAANSEMARARTKGLG